MDDLGPETSSPVEPGAPRLRLLVFAFACNPYLGSEHAAGWGVLRTLAARAEVHAVVAGAHLPELDEWRRSSGDPLAVRLTFSAPGSSRRRRRASPRRPVPVQPLAKGITVVDYQLWLSRAASHARRVVQAAAARGSPFDVAVHATFGTYWLPSPVVDVGLPSVWGPVGGAVLAPRGLRRFQGVRGTAAETAEQVLVRAAARRTATRRTWRDADVVLVESPGARERLSSDMRRRARVANRSVLSPTPAIVGEELTGDIVFPSALEPRKAPRLAIAALARTAPPVRLVFLNDGSEAARLRRFARRLRVDHRVEFRGRVSREELFITVSRSAAALFTGLREEGGAALAEAMALGAPVIVLGHGGAEIVVAATTDAERTTVVRPHGAGSTLAELAGAMERWVMRSVGTAVPRRPYLDRTPTTQVIWTALIDAASTVKAGRGAPLAHAKGC